MEGLRYNDLQGIMETENAVRMKGKTAAAQGGTAFMKLREYEYILAIAREKNMIRAAQYLCISQPALSRLLASVEAEIGTRLFKRCGREMVPTEAGRAYLDNAQRIVELNEQFESQMKQITSSSRQISIACPAVRVNYLIANVLSSVKRQMPEVDVQIKSSSQQNLLNGLNRGDYSLALGIVDDEYERRLSFRLIGTEEMVLVVRKGHPLIEKAEEMEAVRYPRIHPDQLVEEGFVMSRPDSYSARFARNYFEANRISPRVVMQAPLSSMLMPAVADGLGIAILPSIPLKGTVYEDKVCYLSISEEPVSQAVGVMFRRGRELSYEEQCLIKIMRGTYR